MAHGRRNYLALLELKNDKRTKKIISRGNEGPGAVIISLVILTAHSHPLHSSTAIHLKEGHGFQQPAVCSFAALGAGLTNHLLAEALTMSCFVSGRYIFFVTMLESIAPDVVNALSHLFEYYMFTVSGGSLLTILSNLDDLSGLYTLLNRNPRIFRTSDNFKKTASGDEKDTR